MTRPPLRRGACRRPAPARPRAPGPGPDRRRARDPRRGRGALADRHCRRVSDRPPRPERRRLVLLDPAHDRRGERGARRSRPGRGDPGGRGAGGPHLLERLPAGQRARPGRGPARARVPGGRRRRGEGEVGGLSAPDGPLRRPGGGRSRHRAGRGPRCRRPHKPGPRHRQRARAASASDRQSGCPFADLGKGAITGLATVPQVGVFALRGRDRRPRGRRQHGRRLARGFGRLRPRRPPPGPGLSTSPPSSSPTASP